MLYIFVFMTNKTSQVSELESCFFLSFRYMG